MILLFPVTLCSKETLCNFHFQTHAVVSVQFYWTHCRWEGACRMSRSKLMQYSFGFKPTFSNLQLLCIDIRRDAKWSWVSLFLPRISLKCSCTSYSYTSILLLWSTGRFISPYKLTFKLGIITLTQLTSPWSSIDFLLHFF